jgi:hypothetical protein
MPPRGEGPWGRYHAGFTQHEKVQAIPKAQRPGAIALYWAMMGYSLRLLTDGFVPRDVLLGLALECGIRYSRVTVRTLVEAGLVDPVDGGFAVHDYLDWQESRAEVKTRREQDKERKRIARQQGLSTTPSTRTSTFLSARTDPPLSERTSRARATDEELKAKAVSPQRTDSAQKTERPEHFSTDLTKEMP